MCKNQIFFLEIQELINSSKWPKVKIPKKYGWVFMFDIRFNYIEAKLHLILSSQKKYVSEEESLILRNDEFTINFTNLNNYSPI
jgi:hypothetical protein